MPGVVAGPQGHVGVVTTVLPDGSVLIAAYNGEDRSLELLHTWAPRYLYIGVGADVDAGSSSRTTHESASTGGVYTRRFSSAPWTTIAWITTTSRVMTIADHSG